MAELQSQPKLMDRRGFLEKSALLALGLSSTARLLEHAAPAMAESFSTEAKHRVNAAYLPTWLENSEYGDIQRRLKLKGLNRVIVSFAEADRNGEVNVSDGVKPALSELIGHLSAETEVMVAIGGYTADKAGWAAALKNPQKFARSTSALLSDLGKQTGVKFSGVDLDFEYPTPAQSDKLTTLVTTLRDEMPGGSITMAVPASYNLEGFNFKELAPSVNSFNVMTYDDSGSWSAEAGDLAPGHWIIKSVGQAISRIGDQRKVIVGLPAYADEFVGASGKGKHFTSVNQPGYGSLPHSKVKDNMGNLTSEAKIDGNWVSCVSPAVIHQIIQKLYRAHPNLGGSFYWSLDNVVQDQLDAVHQ